MRASQLLSLAVAALAASSVMAQGTTLPTKAPQKLVAEKIEAVATEKGQSKPEPSDEEQEAAKAKAAAKKQAEAQKKAQHLQKIKQLQFDRRPSAILATWSASEEDETEAKGDEKSKPEDEDQPPDQPKKVPDPFDQELGKLQRNVTIGEWVAVKAYLGGLDEALGKALYQRLLQALLQPPRRQASRQGTARPSGARRSEKNVFGFEDIISLAAAAPVDLDKTELQNLGSLLRSALSAGNVIESFLVQLRAEFAKDEEDRALSIREAVRILFAAGRTVDAGEFLPELAKARKEGDHQALNLLSTYYLALYAEEKKVAQLESAWQATMAVFESGKIEKEEKQAALRRAVELAPKIREELGQTWLQDSFTREPQRGMEIIATIGAAASRAMQIHGRRADLRLSGLELQVTAAQSLLKIAPQLAKSWRSSLQLLAGNWLNEAVYAYQHDQSTSIGPALQRDTFGNFYYNNYRRQQQNQVQSIPTGDLLEIKPGSAWLALLDDSVRPKYSMVVAQLYLKVGEEDLAFPYIEELARTHPKQAKDLVDEFLRVWTRNHDPNASRNRTNNYMFMYGFDRRAAGIPLTRSKQERNLTELAGWIKRLRALPIGEPDEELLTRAFMTSHSTAEVYRLEAIERVFGSIASLKPKTLAALVQKMRSNLIGVWSKPSVQKDKGTKRRQKDIQAEILRGYSVARKVIEDSLSEHHDDWALQLAQASVEHDENNFRHEMAPDSEFSTRRNASFATFERAAQSYASTVLDAAEDEQSTQVYELWFYASLGACDLPQVSHEQQPDLKQPAKIRAAILALPGEAAERHMGMFANTLFTRMSSVNPAVKFNYLRGGFEIIGNHKQGREARKVYDYYHDLVTEIKLETVIDGDDVVGHERTFGLFVNIRHTREIERESGGFGKYLQNQNKAQPFAYNYGRPLENYRDKFEEMAQTALGEQFEVRSVTFQSEDVNSRAAQKYGWRVTPYAYLLLKAKGPEVDKIPPLQLDFDFLDTSGYVVLPVASPALPIDATPAIGDTRPVENLAISQTLDERQAAEGKLILEVKCSANGLIPEMAEVLDLVPEGFDLVATEDQGLSVSRFDESSNQSTILSERTWLVTLESRGDPELRPELFHFGRARIADTEMVYQRFVDADLVAVESQFALEQSYGEPGFPWRWVILPGLLVVGLLGLSSYRRNRKIACIDHDLFEVPGKITPFTVLGLLRRIREHDGIALQRRDELDAVILHLESIYFEAGDVPAPDLRSLAEEWVAKMMPAREAG